MLATVLVLPGGLVLLAAVALAVVLMRTSRGQRFLIPLKRRIPPRVRSHAKRIIALLAVEKIFLPEANTVRPA
jgi:hypothetical protein